jgi:hypothetical protein
MMTAAVMTMIDKGRSVSNDHVDEATATSDRCAKSIIAIRIAANS